MKKLSKKLLILTPLLIVVLWFYQEPLKTFGASVFTESKTSSATTTPTFLTAGSATSTQTATVGDADEVWAMLNVVASTSQTRFQWSIEHSIDNVDFYGEDMASTSLVDFGAFTDHSSSTVIHSWTPGIVGTTSKLIKFPDGVGNYVRFNYAAKLANGSMWINILSKRFRY